MFRGLYTAGSALITNNKKIDVVSNNMANVNTRGFKKDLVLIESFENTLISKMNGSSPLKTYNPNQSVKVEAVENYYKAEATNGYIKVQTPKGISYHPRANFTVAEDGYLKTFHKVEEGTAISSDYGYRIIGNNGGPIYVGEGELNIDQNGQVFVDGEVVDNILAKIHPSVIGTMNSGIKLERIETNFSEAQTIRTDNTLDFAIRGDGFFVVDAEEGYRFTRDGSFKLNQYNELVTSEGYLVQGYNGSIVLEGEEITITPYGELMVDGFIADQLDIININNIRDLRKTGEGLFKIADGIEIEEGEFTGEILQGQLEQSNVDPIKEMVEMMTLYRGYESSQKVIQAYDQTIEKAANEIGRI